MCSVNSGMQVHAEFKYEPTKEKKTKEKRKTKKERALFLILAKTKIQSLNQVQTHTLNLILTVQP